MHNEKAARESLSALDFPQATERFEQATVNFQAIVTQLDEQTKRFVAGSSSEEILSAVALCREYHTACRKEWYQSEVQREVRLRPFVIDDHEVTNEEFADFVRKQNYETDAERMGYSMRTFGQGSIKAPGYSWRSPGGESSSHLRYPTHPVVHVSYHDASAYCRWSGGRLPREEEWEYAARGDGRRLFPWGDRWDPGRLRWGGDASQGPMPIRTYPEAATPLGIHDMAGNVWEWTQTRLAEGAVLKGGSWLERNPANFRAAGRIVDDPDIGHTDYGFRCLWELDQWPDR